MTDAELQTLENLGHGDAAEEIRELRGDLAALRNDLSDALDCKNGTGPTALSLVIEERDSLRAELARVTAQRDAILMQARIWSGEAKAQKATVDAVGEILGGVPDWGPIAQGVEQLRADLDHYKQAATKLSAETYDLEAELMDSREREARMRKAGQRLLDAIEHDTQIHRFSILWDGLRAALAEGAQG